MFSKCQGSPLHSHQKHMQSSETCRPVDQFKFLINSWLEVLGFTFLSFRYCCCYWTPNPSVCQSHDLTGIKSRRPERIIWLHWVNVPVTLVLSLSFFSRFLVLKCRMCANKDTRNKYDTSESALTKRHTSGIETLFFLNLPSWSDISSELSE